MKKYMIIGVGCLVVWGVCVYLAATAYSYKATMSNIFDIFSNSEGTFSAVYSQILEQDGHRFWSYGWVPYASGVLGAISLLIAPSYFVFLKLKKQTQSMKELIVNEVIGFTYAIPLAILTAVSLNVAGFVKQSNEITLVEENDITATVQTVEEDCDQNDNCKYLLTLDVGGNTVKLVTNQDSIEEGDLVPVIESKMHAALTREDSVKYRLKDKKKKRKIS